MYDLILKFGVSKGDRIKIIKNLGLSLLDELVNLFRSYWDHRQDVLDDLLQVLGHNIREIMHIDLCFQFKGPIMKCAHLYINYFLY